MKPRAPKVAIEDRLEVQDLISRYAWSLDTGDVEGYVDCFFEDGWIHHDPPGRLEGRDGIRRLTEFLWYEHPFNYLGRQHRMSQVLMTPEPASVAGGVRIKAFWSILQHDVKTFENRVPRTEYRLTDDGRQALAKYLDHMEALIQAMREK